MEEYQSRPNVALPPSEILPEAQTYVLAFHNQQQDARLVYHNYQHTAAIMNKVAEIASKCNIDKTTAEITLLAASFFQLGYLVNYEDAASSSYAEANRFLINKQYPADKRDRVLRCLQVVSGKQMPKTVEEQILFDACQVVESIDHFFDQSPLLRLEWDLMLGRKVSKQEWIKFQYQQLLQTRLFTHYAKINYEPILAEHIQNLAKEMEKNNKNLEPEEDEDGQLRKFQDIERKIPNRAAQTFFRSNYRNHINLSAIADNKANIMISVNAILISVLITVASYQNIAEKEPIFLLPIVIFLVTGLASLIFAVLSARPKVTSLNAKGQTVIESQRNIVFFGNFVQLDLDQYEEAMDALLRDGELLYGNMVRDMYFLGKVLDKKYRYLSISYNIFMVGFITTVIAFLYVLGQHGAVPILPK